jgi:hypothetical protein
MHVTLSGKQPETQGRSDCATLPRRLVSPAFAVGKSFSPLPKRLKSQAAQVTQFAKKNFVWFAFFCG